MRGPSASARFALTMAAQFVLWGLMLLVARGMPNNAAARAGLITGTGLLMTQLCSPAMLSSDVYAYIAHGRALALYHLNPTSAQQPLPEDDPYLAPLGSYLPSPYGPLWSLVGAALAQAGGENVGLTVLLFRLAAVSATVLSSGVLWLLAKELCPQRAGICVVFFLCNPLVIFEMGCGGHNDCWMVAPMLAGVLWAVRGNLPVSAAFFALAALVKAPAALVAVFCILVLLKLLPDWRKRIRHGALAGLVGLLLAGAAFGGVRTLTRADAAARAGFSTLAHAVRKALLGTYYLNSLHEIAFRIGRRLGGEDPQLADATIFFQGWWLKSKGEAKLYRSPTTNSPANVLKKGALVFVAAPQMNDEWVCVYDPPDRQRGFVRPAEFEESSEQLDTSSNSVLADLSLPLGERLLPIRVSLTIRLVTWFVFATAFLFLLRGTRDRAELPERCLILLALALYLVASWFWPWYVIWVLPLAAMRVTRIRYSPTETDVALSQQRKMEAPYAGCYDGYKVSWLGGVARMLAIQLSACALLLYALSESVWTYYWRAAFVFGLPLLGTAILTLIARAKRDRSAHSNSQSPGQYSSSPNR